jgi:hypothetical protein|tara:strand:- start:3 stop:173 length:171 start_codon:yes stop_codon:yes gene_type:complete
MTKFTYNLVTLVMVETNGSVSSKTKFKTLEDLLEDKDMVVEYAEENGSKIEIIIIK